MLISMHFWPTLASLKPYFKAFLLFGSVSKSCFDINFSRWEIAVLLCSMAWVLFCFSMTFSDLIVAK
jgi:hypothetical protein